MWFKLQVASKATNADNSITVGHFKCLTFLHLIAFTFFCHKWEMLRAGEGKVESSPCLSGKDRRSQKRSKQERWDDIRNREELQTH